VTGDNVTVRKNILCLSNYVPEEITDVIRFDVYEPVLRLEGICTYALNFVSQVIADDSIDGAVIPNSCDSIRAARDMALKRTQKFLHQIKHPLRFPADALTVTYYSHEIKLYKTHYENHFNTTITEEAIENRIRLLTGKIAFLKKLYDELPALSYYGYLKAVNESLSTLLSEWEKKLDIHYSPPRGNKRVYLIGPYLSDLSVIRTIEANNGSIVGDDLTNSKRYFSCGGLMSAVKPQNIYETVALRNLARYPSPTSNNFAYIIKKNLEEIEQKEVRGVIFVYQKFCEPHDYIYPLLKEALEKEGIPSLKLQMENGNFPGESLETRITAFLDMI
jgi:benzoyl-CoA reductase/2-hydroxyglutaryl-CoA dehydratase subunit BcrC/BadD/HgdB